MHNKLLFSILRFIFDCQLDLANGVTSTRGKICFCALSGPSLVAADQEIHHLFGLIHRKLGDA